MSNTYTWQFTNLDVLNNGGGYTNMVQRVNWVLTATDASTSHSAELPGATNLPSYNPDSGSYIPFQNLTPQIVEQWVLSVIGSDYDAFKIRLDAEVQEKANANSKPVNPPWQS
jgi:hypothetical protein